MKLKKLFNLKTAVISSAITVAGMGIYLSGTISDINNLYYEKNPTRTRIEFQNTFGFPIRGYSSDIENGKSKLCEIADILAREKFEHDFNISELCIESTNIFLRSNDSKDADESFPSGTAGHFRYSNLSTHVNNDKIKFALGHEIKHAKQKEVKDPIFLETWEKLALDTSGNSTYYDDLGIYNDFSNENLSESNENLGFLSDYARKNVQEDIAVTCSFAEEKTEENTYLKQIKNPIIRKKTQLAIDYKLLPKEFFEYMDLALQYKDLQKHQKKDTAKFEYELFGSHLKDAKKYLEKSEKFLQKNPNSIYTIDVRFDRSKIIISKGNAYGYTTQHRRDAIKELELALNSQYKKVETYHEVLISLAVQHFKLDDKINLEKYMMAVSEFSSRKNNGDVRLPIDGVNDFLSNFPKK